MIASTPDLLRLLVVPVMGWAAWRDVKTRRVPNRTWYPLVALGVLLLVWDGLGALRVGDATFFLRVAISLGFVVPLATGFWYLGSFGGADAKAFYVVALLLPTYPVFFLPWGAYPVAPTPVGVFSITVLSNTVLLGVFYPVAVAGRNLLGGHWGWPMLIGKPVATERVTGEYGVLLETPDGFTRRGLDLDALRMYLRWRDASLAALRADPDTYRDPASLPADPNHPGDGSLPPAEERDAGAADGPDGAGTGPAGETAGDPTAVDGGAGEARAGTDPWGAAAFFEDIEGSAYGSDPATLREGLEVLVERETVWVSPGIPFLVPLFAGLVVAVTYGDLLFSLVSWVGLV